MEIIFDLSSGKIRVATSSITFTLPATSGRGACENSGSKNCLLAPFEGPIPIGMYFIDPKDLSDPNLIGDVARNYRPDLPGIGVTFELGCNRYPQLILMEAMAFFSTEGVIRDLLVA